MPFFAAFVLNVIWHWSMFAGDNDRMGVMSPIPEAGRLLAKESCMASCCVRNSLHACEFGCGPGANVRHCLVSGASSPEGRPCCHFHMLMDFGVFACLSFTQFQLFKACQSTFVSWPLSLHRRGGLPAESLPVSGCPVEAVPPAKCR